MSVNATATRLATLAETRTTSSAYESSSPDALPAVAVASMPAIVVQTQRRNTVAPASQAASTPTEGDAPAAKAAPRPPKLATAPTTPRRVPGATFMHASGTSEERQGVGGGPSSEPPPTRRSVSGGRRLWLRGEHTTHAAFEKAL